MVLGSIYKPEKQIKMFDFGLYLIYNVLQYFLHQILFPDQGHPRNGCRLLPVPSDHHVKQQD